MLALGLLLAGCGSDDDPVEEYQVQAVTTMAPAEPPLTKRQFIAQVSEFCRDAWESVAENWETALERRDAEPRGRPEFGKALRGALLAGIDFFIFDPIRRLGSPPGEERAVEEIIGPLQRSVELGQMGLWRARSVLEVPQHFAEYNRRARRYGLAKDCLVDQTHLRALER